MRRAQLYRSYPAALDHVIMVRRLAPYLRSCAQDLSARGFMSPAAVRLLDYLPDIAQPIAVVLAWTYCRWAELEYLDIGQVQRGGPIDVAATKGSADRIAPRARPVLHAPDQWPATVPGLATTSYDTLCASIAHARDRAGITLPDHAYSYTHLFRHLHASWRAEQGWTIDEIRDEMGHRSARSTAHYTLASIGTADE